MFEIKIDDKNNRLYPHAKVLEAYADEKRGNGYERQRRAEDDTYEGWYNACRRNPFYVVNKTVFRTRAIIQGKLTEVLLAYSCYTGNSKMGDTIGQDLEYYCWQGFYDEPLFEKKLNQKTDQLETIGVRDHVRRYTLPFTEKNLQMLYDQSDDATKFMVKETAEAQAIEVYDREGFGQANFAQLIEMAKLKRSLAEVRNMAEAVKNIKEKVAEAKAQAIEQADIANNIGEPESAAEIQQTVKDEEAKIQKIVTEESLNPGDEVEKATTTTVKKKSKK